MPSIMLEASATLLFYVNGKKVEEANVDPEWTLLWYLRNKLRLVGTKLACGEGGCGACTVMLSKFIGGETRHFSVNACLFPLASLHATSVTTVEGIGSCRSLLHPLQERLAKAHGSQCGFCTPGFIMSAYALLRSKDTAPTMEEMEDALVGNLCRCTGYRPILEAFKTFTGEKITNGCGRTDCCKLKSNGFSEDLVMTDVLYDSKSFTPYEPTQELIFPPELKLNPGLVQQCLKFTGPNVTFYQVNSLQQLLEIKHEFPHAKLVVGNTELGVEIRYKNQLYPVLVNVNNIEELKTVERKEDGMLVGAAVSLSDLKEQLDSVIMELPAEQTWVLSSLVEMLRWFAGKQIRNVACLGGNILTCSPISDINPILLAAKATLYFQGINGGRRSVVMDSSFFTGYRRCAVLEDEVLVAVKIPFTQEGEYFRSFKQSRRRDDDIATVNAAMRVTIDLKTSEVKDATLAFGGVAATTVLAKRTSEMLVGMTWSDRLVFEKVCSYLMEEVEVQPSAPGGMSGFRTALVPSFFFKFNLFVRNEISKLFPDLITPLSEEEKSVFEYYEKPHHKATHFFQKVSPSQSLIDPVGRPVAHSSALEQCTGEAVYVDDMPSYSNELHVGVVLSTKAKAKILNVDASEALALEGVHCYVSEKELPGKRNSSRVGPLEENIFARSEVICVGQLIGIIVAESPELAEKAARLVKIHYTDVEKPIVTLQEAIAAKSWHKPRSIVYGDVNKGHNSADFTLEGEVHLGGQEHFYMETNCHMAVPLENGSMEVYSSTQNPGGIQIQTAAALAVPANRVVIKTKRMGGGFGGKESRSFLTSVPVAVAADITRRPVRISLDRHTDMLMTGGRHPFLGRWTVSFTKEGLLKAVEANLYSNNGSTSDLSFAVTDRALFSFDNGYKCDNWLLTGYDCITNLPSNTAFRAFGAPQGVMVMESIMSQVAAYLKIDSKEIREINLYHEGDITPIRKKLENCPLRRCWGQVIHQSEYERRRGEVDAFNSSNKFKKRGLAVSPGKFGVSFTISFLNQGGALVMIYRDGSVLVTHGGTEMGQGLHTKTMQIAARVLEIPLDRVYISETSTDKVPNGSPTAASMGSDLYGEAVLRACTTLKSRLESYKQKYPDGGWNKWVISAYLDQVELTATGYYGVKGIGEYNFETQVGDPFSYYAIGAAVTEVEIEALTGDHTVLRTDIVMDVGDSLNPAIDIGQIEGAFVQGQGLFTLEELRYTPDGTLLTRGPGMYKLPGIQDIPCEFNVTLLRDSPNPKAVYSSRAIGEPPLILATSVVVALRDAISAYRKDFGEDDHFFRLDTPVTAEKIRMNCQDFITKKIPKHEPGSFKPWDVTV